MNMKLLRNNKLPQKCKRSKDQKKALKRHEQLAPNFSKKKQQWENKWDVDSEAHPQRGQTEAILTLHHCKLSSVSKLSCISL